jgi:hypothetical protein
VQGVQGGRGKAKKAMQRGKEAKRQELLEAAGRLGNEVFVAKLV